MTKSHWRFRSLHPLIMFLFILYIMIFVLPYLRCKCVYNLKIIFLFQSFTCVTKSKKNSYHKMFVFFCMNFFSSIFEWIFNDEFTEYEKLYPLQNDIHKKLCTYNIYLSFFKTVCDWTKILLCKNAFLLMCVAVNNFYIIYKNIHF